MKDESLSQRFARIREYYRTELPKMMAEYDRTGRVHFDPYRLDFTSDMTPIEAAVWSDIRCAGLPFLPQIPALNYFLDFADPFKRIAIECDGKQWHDAEKTQSGMRVLPTLAGLSTAFLVRSACARGAVQSTCCASTSRTGIRLTKRCAWFDRTPPSGSPEHLRGS